MSKQYYFENVKYPYVKEWDKTGDYVEFYLKDVHFSLANALRRCMISQVKTIGFRTEPFENSTVKIIHNDSSEILQANSPKPSSALRWMD